MAFDNTAPVAITPSLAGAFNNTAPVRMVQPFVVRVASTGASGPPTDEIVTGDTIDGVVIGEGDRILRYGTNDLRDGVFVIGAAGVQTIAASEADEEDELPPYVKVLEGATKGGKVFSLAVVDVNWPDVLATEMAATPVMLSLASTFSKAPPVAKVVT